MVIDSDTGLISGQISQFNISSPYQTTADNDTSFEEGSIPANKIGQLQITELDIALSETAVNSLGEINITQSSSGEYIINFSSTADLVISAVDGQNYIELAAGDTFEDITISSRNDIDITPSGDLDVTAQGSLNDVANGNIQEETQAEYVVSANGSFVIQAPHGLMEVDGDNLYLYSIGGSIVGNGTQIVNSSGVKTAIVKTSKGYKALYTNESPDVWFMDFCKGKKKRKFPKFWQTYWDIHPDLTFLEITEKPYIVMPTGLNGIVQLWAKRKGTRGLRFAPKTEKEFEKNNQFWDSVRIDKLKKRA